MKCIECGHELKDGAVFCIRCGAMQVSMDGRDNAANAAGTAPIRPSVGGSQGAGGRHVNNKSFTPAPKRSTASVAVPIVAAVAVLVAAGALAFFVLNPGASKSGSAQSASTAATATTTSDSASSTTGSTASTSTSSASASTTTTSDSAASGSTTSASDSTASASTSAASTTSTTINTTSTTNTTNTTNTTTTTQTQEQTYTPTDDSYYLDDTSSRYYSRSEVENMSDYDLYYARNEIFARHGRMFNNSDLQSYFNSKSWYDPIYSPAEFEAMKSPLNDVETANVKLMLDVEQKRNSPYV